MKRKRDCAYTRKALLRYLQGHLFKYQQMRVGRHLKTCAVCRSEFESLRKAAETQQLIREILPPDGMLARMKAAMVRMARLKMLLYRPLWLLAIVAGVTLLAMNVFSPRPRDIEIENLEKALPPPAYVASAPVPTTAHSSPAATVEQAAVQKREPKAPEAAVEPLLITITPHSDEAVQHINAVMQGTNRLSTMKFSETVRQISGEMTASELTAFLGRIEQDGKAGYGRKRLASIPASQQIPFIMRIKQAPKPVPTPVEPQLQQQSKPQPQPQPEPQAQPATPAQ